MGNVPTEENALLLGAIQDLYGKMNEPMNKPRKFAEAKCIDTPCQNGITASRHCSTISVFPIVVQSGESGYLRRLMKVNHAEHGKPDTSHSGEGKEEQMRETLAPQNFNGWYPERKGGGRCSGYGKLEKVNASL